MSNKLEIILGERNGDGRARIEYVLGSKTFPDALFLESAMQREKSVRSAMDYFAIPTERLADLLERVVDLAAQEKDGKPIEFRRISCAELDSSEYEMEYLIDNALVARQPCILAGGKKTLKTSLLIDLGVSLATGGYFLGRLKVNRACRVGIMSGESGLATIQETARRIAAAAGHNLADIGGLVFSDQLPQFANFLHLEAMKRFCTNDELEVIAIDPAYLCIGEADHGNLFAMGERLQGVSRLCEETGVTFLLAHHNKKTGKADPFSARVGRYCLERIPGVCPAVVACRPAGTLRTWQRRTSAMAFRGRFCGPQHCMGIDIAEGTRKTEGGRYWQVDVKPASEARQDANTRQAEAKQQRAAERRTAELESDRKELVRILTKAHEPQTKTRLRDMSFGGADSTAPLAVWPAMAPWSPWRLPSRITVPTRRGNCANRQTITPND